MWAIKVSFQPRSYWSCCSGRREVSTKSAARNDTTKLLGNNSGKNALAGHNSLYFVLCHKVLDDINVFIGGERAALNVCTTFTRTLHVARPAPINVDIATWHFSDSTGQNYCAREILIFVSFMGFSTIWFYYIFYSTVYSQFLYLSVEY